MAESTVPRRPQARFDVVAIGASAGGVEALQVLVGGLPKDFAAALLIVQHLDPRHKSLLAFVIGRHSALPVRQAQHGEVISPGTVYIAPPDMHLLVAGGCIELSRSNLVHYTRPSIDLLLESVAGAYGPRAIGVILTGTGVDGATGIRAVKGTGGTTIVQDPSDAAHRGMPQAAYATGCVDFTVPLEKIAPMLVHLTSPNNLPETRSTHA